MVQTAIRNPRVTQNLISRDQTVGLEEHRVLVVGQMLSGSATAGALTKGIPRTDADINALFGARSHMAMMLREMRAFNLYTKIDAIGLADAGGATAATSVFLSNGTATEAKTIYLDVVSSYRYSMEIDIEVGDDEAALTAKILAKAALLTSAPFTAAKSTDAEPDDTLTFTAANGGTVANGWLIRIHDVYGNPTSVAGLTFTLTGWTGGATDPTLTSIFDPTANIRYHGVVWPSEYATTVPKAWINARFNLDNDIKDGVVFQWVNDTFANVKSAAAAMNSPSWVAMYNEPMNTAYWKGPHLPEAPDVIAAQFTALRALRFEDGISISRIVVTNEFNDQFGGIHTASLPYFNTPFANMGTPDDGAGLIYPEQLELDTAGVSVIGSNVTRNTIISSVMKTTFLNDAAGNPDDTWSYLNWRDTHSVIREFFVNNLRRDFAQHRLSTGVAVANYAMATEPVLRAAMIGYYDQLAEIGITVKGRDARQIFENGLSIVLTPSLRRVAINSDVPMVSQLGEIIGSIKFNFAVA